jgi:hypothetical protein
MDGPPPPSSPEALQVAEPGGVAARFSNAEKMRHVVVLDEGSLILKEAKYTELFHLLHEVHHGEERTSNKRQASAPQAQSGKFDFGIRSGSHGYAGQATHWIPTMHAGALNQMAPYTADTFYDAAALASSIGNFGRAPVPERRVNSDELVSKRPELASILCEIATAAAAALKLHDPSEYTLAIKATAPACYMRGGTTSTLLSTHAIPGSSPWTGITCNWDFVRSSTVRAELGTPPGRKRRRPSYTARKIAESAATWHESEVPPSSNCPIVWHKDDLDVGAGVITWWTLDPNQILFGGAFMAQVFKHDFLHVRCAP